MAASVIKSLLEKLNEERMLLLGARDQVQWIEHELEITKEFLNFADKLKERYEIVDSLIDGVREWAYDAEDILDEFIVQMESIQQRSGFIPYVLSPTRAVNEEIARHQFATKMQQIKQSGIIEKRNLLMIQRKKGSKLLKCHGYNYIFTFTFFFGQETTWN
ncbi:hypothetical protein AMTR_s00006p00263840 [Amborella trichopoda]|uniref:Disease resistance N-terminal domain-containing protein n=1 Tax=Amborella trichopoda TaxID=13333 RepID=W1PDS6_AMBTC|nr:hypothetical protein AMTR_s00006p00263840 [Amborella trichopoda]